MAKRHRYWWRTSRLMWGMVAVWAVFGFAVPMFAPLLNQLKFLGFPLGFYMAAQGSLIAFVAMLFWFNWRQDKIDNGADTVEDETHG